MMEPSPIRGVIAIPQTPFDDGGSLDLDSLGRGVAGVLVQAPAG